ncbi:MAG: cold shock domain-containing protein [Endozoicomonadaceae bacterium]|nr:cold shock domain-containing protein [Endozoicomonadaceae bacterium]
MDYLTGVVKWFNNAKGLGFISPVEESSDEDIFVHYSNIKMDHFKTLNAGQTVRFLMERGNKGFLATEVIPEQKMEEDAYEIVRESRDEGVEIPSERETH